MNTQEAANRLFRLCREGKFVNATDELYDENIVSLEPIVTGNHFACVMEMDITMMMPS